MLAQLSSRNTCSLNSLYLARHSGVRCKLAKDAVVPSAIQPCSCDQVIGESAVSLKVLVAISFTKKEPLTCNALL